MPSQEYTVLSHMPSLLTPTCAWPVSQMRKPSMSLLRGLEESLCAVWSVAAVQDVLDLRENNWVPRTKKEGPKKIQDIHREAQREMDMQAQRDRDERQRDRRGGGDRYGGPPPPRAPNTYDRLVSKDEMLSKPMASMNRATSSELSFRPQGGGFGAKGGNRNPSPAAAAAAASAASNLPNSGSGRHQPQQPSSRTATPPPPPPPPTTMSPEDMRKDGK